MKLDRIKFGELVAFISVKAKFMLNADDIRELNYLTEINVEPVATQYVEAIKVNTLLMHLNREGGLIEAIKAYRSLTGAGLKESKDAIERYRNYNTHNADTLTGRLYSSNYNMDEKAAIEHFIKNL